MKALKIHALHLLRVKRKASRLHRNLLVRSPKSWLSNMKAKLTAEIGSVCFMQPTISQKRRGPPKVKLLRVHKHARLNSLFDTTQKHQVLISATGSLPLKAQAIDLRDTGIDNEEYSRASEQAPQNVFGLCRSPRNNMLRRLAEKGFVLCTVVLRKDAHVVDRCEDLPVDDIHTMQAVQKIHENLADPSLPMLGYVPTTLPAESPQRLLTILKDLERTVPPATFEEAINDNCVTHISQELREVENSHILELWNTAEMKKAVNSELLLRSMVKFAHFNLREIAPESAPEYRLSLIKLANKWTRTTELIRKFNEAVASCPSPTIRPVYFPQYESKILPLPHESVSDLLFQLRRLLSIEIPPIHRLLIGGAYLFSFTLNQRDIAEGTGRREISSLVQDICKLLTDFASLHLQPKAKSYVEKYLQEVSETANRLLDIALNTQVQWRLIRTILVTPFWIFAFGRHCGPADKQTAFELGYGLCPYHLLSFFFKEAAAEATKQPGLQNWAIRFIGKWAKSIEARTLPEMAGEPTEVFLEQQVQNLPQLHPDLFYSRGGKVFKVSPFQK
ncbi:hypothetical protein, conserved [Eimeria necatrix]|uniref:Uncharacterized protein n=1 Tax=Eimeria necatrix TaxID=51315 RepID=U6MUU8_9EIME|nr:hypothetical protein, conserved [Eimeria necatrix]CDJ66224.1 hypothetical protein, conserved [Eimeria necatrix]